MELERECIQGPAALQADGLNGGFKFQSVTSVRKSRSQLAPSYLWALG